ncbi:hypothetical protein AACK17_11275 [Pectobacterium punjabense]|uniref:hypothetical protein n=1 Tax=Pectobacterium punjabense TaxID=2108399 RepID=UPI00311E4BCB
MSDIFVRRMAENNGSDATFSCVLWQKMDKRKVCQSVMVWGRGTRRETLPPQLGDQDWDGKSKKAMTYALISARVGP